MSRATHLRYVPVLSEPAPDWTGRSGLVHAAVLEDAVDLSACDVYAAGPPAMIQAVLREFPLHGARVDRLCCDSFDYASDEFARQRPSAATKS
jgi:CDP-4-dehydro-6-deoxyglucose reductase